MKINSNHSNLAFDKEMDKCHEWIGARVFAACGYSARDLVDRLTQRIVELVLCPYASKVKELSQAGADAFPGYGARISGGKVTIETGSGRAFVSLRQWAINQVDFFLHWLFCLFALLSKSRFGSTQTPITLVYGVGAESLFTEQDDRQFVEYCRNCEITPLRNGSRFLIEMPSKAGPFSCSDFLYTARPMISLVQMASFGFGGRARLVANHLLLLITYAVISLRMPLLSVLGREFAYSSTSFALDRRGYIESLILTCSSFTSQPLWMRRLVHAKVHMIWYAQNWKPIAYLPDHLQSDVPNLRWIRVNTHWVWTEPFAEYLRQLGHREEIAVVKPIMWRLPETGHLPKERLQITVFDISPYSDDIALSYGEISNYNNADNLHKFIKDIINLRSKLEANFGMPVSVCLKTKRGYKAVYDRSYFDYLDELNQSGALSQAHFATNIFSLVSQSHLVIVYPFSSPAYIADFLRVPSIYYDPAQSILCDHFGGAESMIRFINTEAALLNASISAITDSLSKGKMATLSGEVN